MHPGIPESHPLFTLSNISFKSQPPVRTGMLECLVIGRFDKRKGNARVVNFKELASLIQMVKIVSTEVRLPVIGLLWINTVIVDMD